MKVLFRGTGTIGKPLIRIALEVVREHGLGLSEVFFHKYSFDPLYRPMLEDFLMQGAKLVVDAERKKGFESLLKSSTVPHTPIMTFEEAVELSDVIVDCTDKGYALKAKEAVYNNAKGRKLFIAQGSEKGFGKPYALDINDRALVPDADRFLQVVSCNTHQILCILKTLAFDPANRGEWQEENLVRARFYLARRAADISQTNSTIGVEVGKPKHVCYGSHQAEDAVRVLATVMKRDLDIHAAADTINNPFMHTIYFSVVLRERLTLEEVEKRFRHNPLIAITGIVTNNQVFSEGRDRGYCGRILNQTVVCRDTLEVISGGREIVGRCFTPQDSNALLSSIAAILWFRDQNAYREKLARLFYKRPYLFTEV